MAAARRGNAHATCPDEAAKPHELLRRHCAAPLLHRPLLSCVQTAHTEQKTDVSPRGRWRSRQGMRRAGGGLGCLRKCSSAPGGDGTPAAAPLGGPVDDFYSGRHALKTYVCARKGSRSAVCVLARAETERYKF